MEARLRTAVSSAGVYSTISAQRLLHLIVPRCCWFDLALQVSFYSMNGIPVSAWASRMADHSLRAETTFLPLPARSYLQGQPVQHSDAVNTCVVFMQPQRHVCTCNHHDTYIGMLRIHQMPLWVCYSSSCHAYLVYSASNSSPQTSASPGATLGQKSVQGLSLSARAMKRSLTQRPEKRSRARASSVPWFYRSSRNSNTSACHGSRYIAKELQRPPPPWLKQRTAALKRRSVGTRPLAVPRAPRP